MGQPSAKTEPASEEATVIGTRYLHPKYKTWFRILWGVILFFFLGLTIYQVCERINYYFIRNPLNTRRTYETPQSILFPSVAICNKMQIRASTIVEMNADLARALSSAHEDDGKVTSNETFLDSLSMFNDVNMTEIYRNSHQKIEDLFVSCEMGKAGSCMDDITPFLTSNGLCFKVTPNVTVRRPGPEITLSLLLNLEAHEIIPGMVPDPGIMLSIQDDQTVEFSQGIHLEAGKVVTIPINEVRKLNRFERYCGRMTMPPFSRKEYSLASCQWATTMERVERICSCRSIGSPYNRFVLSGVNGSNVDTGRKKIKPCTLKEELMCVQKAFFADGNDWPMIETCPEDCHEISYPSVVFGESLYPSQVATYLPSDWDDTKENKIAQFQKILEVIPLERIPVVRSLQTLATQFQEFLSKASEIFGADNYENGSSCLADKGFRFMDNAFLRIKSAEPHWEAVATYVRHSLSRQMNTTATSVGLKMNEDGQLNGFDAQFTADINLVELALTQLRSMEVNLQPESMFGLRHLPPDTRAKIMRHVEPFIRRMHKCLLKLRNKPHQTEEIGGECRSIFTKHYEVLADAWKFYSSTDTSSEHYIEYNEIMTKIVAVLRRASSRVYMASWKDHKFDLKRVEALYRDDGPDNIEIVELLKLRKMFTTDAAEAMWKLVGHIDAALEAKRRFEHRFEINATHEDMDSVRRVMECLRKSAESTSILKKSIFIRGEWLPRLQRLVQTAQSFSVGPQYDQVNLLHIKLYFAHFKQETIVQDRSYNLFLLLAEIGGTMGLYVGASLLSVAETVVYFFEKKIRNNVVKPANV